MTTGRITWDKLLKALEADFEGYGDIWQLCHDAPKFGEDDDYADSIATDTFNLVTSTLMSIPDIRGTGHGAIFQSVAVFVRAGRVTAALPCGRRARQPLADGGASPEAGDGKGRG